MPTGTIQYGNAKHFLKGSANAIALTPQDGAGNAYTSAVFVSPIVTDISVSVGGNKVDFMNYQGINDSFEVNGEYIEVTYTLLPSGSTAANALLSASQYRIGTPFAVTNAPVLKLAGHGLEATVAGGSADAFLKDCLNSTYFLQSINTTMTLEGATTGTITLRRPILASIVATAAVLPA
jgi:hypothetical protein